MPQCCLSVAGGGAGAEAEGCGLRLGVGGSVFPGSRGLKVEAEGGRQVRGHFSLLKTRARRPAVPLGPGQGRGACETSGSISFKDGSPQGQVGAEDELIFPTPPLPPPCFPSGGFWTRTHETIREQCVHSVIRANWCGSRRRRRNARLVGARTSVGL